MSDRLTDSEIGLRIACASLLGEPAATEVRTLALEVLELRARVAEFEASIRAYNERRAALWPRDYEAPEYDDEEEPDAG